MTGAEIRLSIAELPESFPAFHVAVALVQGIALGEDRDSDVEAFVAAAEGQARDALSNMAPADFPEI